MRRTFKPGLAVLAATTALVALAPGAAQAQTRIPCGDFYEVQAGDTLREIALDAYGEGNYQVIFEANTEILSTPSLLYVGQRLFIPCLDGSGPRTRAEAEAPLATEQTALRPPEPSPEGLALPAPLPQPSEEELFGAPEPEVGEASEEPAPEAPVDAAAAALARLQPAPSEGAGPQPAPGGAAQPGPTAGIQPAPGGAAQPGPTAAVQPAPGGAAQPGPTAGIQPAPGGAAQPGPTAAVQPAPGGAAQPAPTAGIQPAPAGAAQPPAGGQGGAVQPAPAEEAAPDPLSRLLAEGETVAEPAAEETPAAGAGGGFEAPVTARLLPESAPPPPAQAAPEQPVPRLALNLDSGLGQPEDGPGAVADAGSSAVGGEAALPPIRLLTGPYAPYTGETLPEQGMLTDVVSRALEKAAPEREARIAFIDDWSAHLTILLPEGAFDLGFPWFKPDCTRMELLSAPMQARCTEYLWSQPLHELVVGYFVQAGSPLESVSDPAELVGLTFCRPAGYYTFDLEQRGLGEPRVTIVRPETPADCLQRLVAGDVDVVSLSVTLVEGELAEAGLIGQVTELPDLADILTMHVLGPRTNPFARTYLTLVNRGLREMRESGEWFEVVARHMADFQERVR